MRLLPRRTVLVAGLTMALSITAFAEEKKDKPKLLMGASTAMLTNACSGCHGQDGVSNGPAIPTIAGLSTAYFVETMEGYKSGDVPATIMGRMAEGYTTEEFEQMAEFYAGQSFVAAVGQESDAALAEQGAKIHDKYCEKCHSESGTVADDDSGFLQGQWKPYLADQLNDYHNKDRKATKKMAKKLKKMHEKVGENVHEALLEYYSSTK